MADFLRKFEAMYPLYPVSHILVTHRPPKPSRFTVTPQRMRMIVEAFKDSLELGLSKPGQVVVSPPSSSLLPFSINQS